METTERIAELAGSSDAQGKCSTLVFQNEGHTFGNALRSIIASYPEVEFCGYTLPHPSEPILHFRIQTYGPKAHDILKRGLEDLEKVCDHILSEFENEIEEFEQVKMNE